MNDQQGWYARALPPSYVEGGGRLIRVCSDGSHMRLCVIYVAHHPSGMPGKITPAVFTAELGEAPSDLARQVRALYKSLGGNPKVLGEHFLSRLASELEFERLCEDVRTRQIPMGATPEGAVVHKFDEDDVVIDITFAQEDGEDPLDDRHQETATIPDDIPTATPMRATVTHARIVSDSHYVGQVGCHDFGDMDFPVGLAMLVEGHLRSASPGGKAVLMLMSNQVGSAATYAEKYLGAIPNGPALDEVTLFVSHIDPDAWDELERLLASMRECGFPLQISALGPMPVSKPEERTTPTREPTPKPQDEPKDTRPTSSVGFMWQGNHNIQ